MKTVYYEELTVSKGLGSRQTLVKITVKYSKKEKLAIIKPDVEYFYEFRAAGGAKTIMVLDARFIVEHANMTKTTFLENQNTPYYAIREAVSMTELIKCYGLDTYIREANEEEKAEYYA